MKVKRQTNKVKVLTVSAHIIADLCKRAVENKAPHDAEVLRVVYDGVTNNYKVLVWSSFFPEIEEGSMPPDMAEPVISEDIFKKKADVVVE